MPRLSETQFDAVSALWKGARDHQEDAVVADFPLGSEGGVIVLSDGMGGHAAGDVASKIVMTEVFSELKFQISGPGLPPGEVARILRGAAEGANDCLRAHIAASPEVRGMGATLVAALVAGDRLHWISVGDSLLLLFRDGRLRQLNEDHSMAPQIDFMVTSGMMDSETARDHPDRNALLSVLAGDPIVRIDCPEAGLLLRDGDILIAASDGLQFLDLRVIERILGDHRTQHSYALARLLLGEIAELDDPDQDNASIAVVKVQLGAGRSDDGPIDIRDAVLPGRPWRSVRSDAVVAERWA